MYIETQPRIYTAVLTKNRLPQLFSKWFLQQDGRLPYFKSSQFGKGAILKDSNVFSSRKHTFLSSTSLVFPTLKVLYFLQKNLILKSQETFLRNFTIWYAFYQKFLTLLLFQKFKISSRKTHLLLRKTQILNDHQHSSRSSIESHSSSCHKSWWRSNEIPRLNSRKPHVSTRRKVCS